MKHKIPYILFLFSAIFTYGQVTLAVSDVKNPRVNQRFNLTVILEISGENMEQETPLRMPDLSKFDIIGSASEQNTVVLDAKKGDVLNQMVYQWVLTPKEAGKIRFGSVLVTVNGKIYKTEPFEINVKDNEKKSAVAEHTNHSNEVYLNLELKKNVVYKNEPAVAVLRAYSKDYDNFRKVSNLQFSPQKNASIKPINYTKSEIETSSGMASQVIGTFMIFPNESGPIAINAFSAVVGNATKPTKVSSNRVRLNVKKLPDGMPSNFKNAVGNFEVAVSQTNTDEIPEVDKPLNISVRLSGAGNFGSLDLPKIIDSPDYVFYTPQITTKTVPQKDGLSGDVIAEYVVIPKKAGSISINFENFSFFNPKEVQYTDLGPKSLLLNVKTPGEIADAKSTIEKVNDYTNIVLETVNTPVLQTHNLKIKNKDKINWKIVAGNLGLMVAVLSLFVVLKKRQEKKKVKPQQLRSSISIAETEEIIRKKIGHQFDENIEYLKILKENKDFETFFTAYQELNNETKNFFSVTNESEFRNYLEQNKGAHVAEQYRILSEKIQIEKYAPFHTAEHIDLILEAIISFYNEIIK
ncbi:Oxygen tolerance [Kaistella chaponensis]|uniref:Oxygen tolerance n=1 Tax=Kaistella chaponensis TaxID=713588 RepID=A0A1N7J908_9FLAO|nr:BatD family protein [Kaistella chaponensis]SIS45835.1 Oxygen tolerance [Kaistella chaponensis]